MSLDRKSVHVRLAPEQHEQLAVLANVREKDMAELSALFLEKAIVGEFHAFSVELLRMQRLGLTGIGGDLEGTA
jgi:hypothetical protein